MAMVLFFASSLTDWVGVCLCPVSVRSDQISSEITTQSFFPVNLHGGFDLFPFPYTAGGIVRGTKNSEMDVVFFDFLIHILIIHPPYAVFILLQIAQDDFPAVVFQRSVKPM